jgi:hypothetical protein
MPALATGIQAVPAAMSEVPYIRSTTHAEAVFAHHLRLGIHPGYEKSTDGA